MTQVKDKTLCVFSIHLQDPELSVSLDKQSSHHHDHLMTWNVSIITIQHTSLSLMICKVELCSATLRSLLHYRGCRAALLNQNVVSEPFQKYI